MTAKIRTLVCCLILLICVAQTKSQLVANFIATPLSGCTPLVVQFSDQSTGNPTQWKWDLGNGTISFLQNPSVTYFNPGQYSIKLVVRNSSGADSIIKSQYITVNATPTVNFSGTPTTGCFPLPVQFTDQSLAGSGSISTWEWDFGDGISSSLQNPSHTYTAPGNYNVSLRIKNSNGCIKTLSKTQYIQISNGVTANFTNTVPNSCNPPATINFQNLSTGTGALAYQWSFGDGGTSVLANPSHTYAAAGSYTVTLIATSSNGCTDTIIKTNAITIGSVAASFTSPDNVCTGAAISFTNTSTPAPGVATWYFGDGTSATGIHATKIYPAPGTYIVKMIASFGACIDSAFKTITVLAKPTAAFSAPTTSSCKPPLTVNFSSSSTDAVHYNWNFGDGNTGTGPAPSHTYTAYGSYTVTLIASNASGCSDTLTMPGYINISPTDVQINNLPRSGCAPFSWVFSTTTTTIDPIVSYLWNFGDGNTGTGATPAHTYTAAGNYTVSVIVTTASGCTDTATVVAGITVSTKPVANFTANPRDVCAKLPVNFTDQSTGTITQWLWIFGDGGTSTDQNPIYEYQDTGYFDVTLIVWNNGCPDSIKFTNYIHVKPPIAAFTTTFACGNPRQITFTAQSVGADQWTWNFGDGTTSTTQNPVHTYADTGTYTVTLTVVNLTTGCDYTKTQTIRIISEKANFFATDTIICKGVPIGFSSVGSIPANIAAYDWDFGDGVSGTGASISHVYTQAGTYNVRLIITDVAGCRDTLSKPLYIRVDGPTADFTSTVPGSCLNSAVAFTDGSVSDGTHAIQQWIWNYGDGNADTLTTPPFQHTYAGAGVYTVSLKVTDSRGCADSITKASLLVISKPFANFGTLDTLSCPNKPINFSNLSTGPGLTYAWYFGDGNTSTQANPVHNYVLDGIYTVKLVITDQYGCTDSITRAAYVNIITPVANFTMSDSLSTCPPLIVQFTNTSTVNNTVTWDFGDGTSAQVQNPSHFYSYPGVFNVTLTVTGPGGCTDTRQKQIIVRGPQGNFTYAPRVGCNPLTINFTGTTVDRISFIWDFNDGTTNSTTDSIVSHTYTNIGVYVPKMILVDAGGCQVPITGLDTIVVNGVDAKFGLTSNTICDAGFINFTDSSQSNDVITSYEWDFGDGAISTAQNPVHYYAAAGQYFPKLIVRTQSGCADTVTNIAPVKIVASPQAAITASPAGCAPLTATFNAGLLVADTSAMAWNWNLGNGNTSTLQNPPPQLYNNPTTYTIQLVATNSSGCADTVTQTIDAYVVPVVQAGADTMICKGVGTTLVASGATNYTWSPSTGLSCTNCPNPVATPDSVTRYTVRGVTPQGCSNTDTVEVRVKYPFVMSASLGDTLCKGGSLRLFATGAYSYTWSPAAGLSSTTSATPLATPGTTTLYRVIGTDDRGCFTDTSYVPIQVYPIPTVSAGADKTINVGQTVDLIPTLSADVTSAVWTPTTGIFRTNYPAITVKPKETTAYTIEVRNPGGCKARDQVTVFVVCNGSNVFIPNTFSPNNDGSNDVFYPRGSGLFSIKTLRIFNRWGEIVFENNNFLPNVANAGWDGTYKGAKLLPDVYVYTMEIICDNSTTLVYKGNVALIQ
jgi:gliding motility-associated-like protein